MFNYEYKERDYANEILKKGFTSSHIKHELKILVKYYKDQGCKPKERKELIYKFCEENLEGYDRVTHYKMINSVLNYGSNKLNKLIQIDSVGISGSELNYIDGLEIQHDYKKILFTLLILDKLNKKFYLIRNESTPDEEYYFSGRHNYKKLIAYSNIKLKSSNQIHKIIHELSEIGLVEIRAKSKIKLLFMYEIPKDDEVGLEIKNFEKIGLYYDLHSGISKIKKCENCGEPVKVTSNRSKYCESCREVIEIKNNRRYSRESMRRLRDSKNVKGLENSQKH